MVLNMTLLKQANADRWHKAKVTHDFMAEAAALVAPSAKERYLVVQEKTNVPWAFVAVVHMREASQSWTANLAQGDPWDRVSIHIPAGRGPFDSWEDAAVDALVNCAPHPSKNLDWSIGGILTLLEQYNGLGYAMRHLPSPYVWAGTDQYHAGKFTADGFYNPHAVDGQPGCAGLLMAMGALDSDAAKLVGPPVSDIKPPGVIARVIKRVRGLA